MILRTLAVLILPAVSLAGIMRPMTGVPLVLGLDEISGSPVMKKALLFRATLTATPHANVARGNPGFTFGRALQATYKDANDALAVAGVNEARFSPSDYGVMIEDTEKNEVTRSEQFEHGDWTETTASVFQDCATCISPYAVSATVADHLRETADDALHTVYQEYTGTAGETDALSVFAKKAERNFLNLQFWDYDGALIEQFFDLNTGVIGSATVTAGGGSGVSLAWVAMEPYVDGWYRCMIVVNTQADTSRAIDIGVGLEDLKGAYLGDTSKGIYICGAQVERSIQSSTKYMSSYIKTEGSALTRPADVLDYGAYGNLPDGGPGTILATATQEIPAKAEILDTRASGSTNGVQLYIDSTLAVKGIVFTSGAQTDLDGIAQMAANTEKSLALYWDQNDSALYEDSVLAEHDTACDVPPLHAGGVRLNAQYGGGVFVKNVRVYKHAVSAWELALE